MKATVYKSTGSWYRVKTEEGEFLNARIKGKFKTEDITSTNPLAVGDRITIAREEDDVESVMITGIDERRNYMTRKSPHNDNQNHIIASNLDQCLLMASLKEPKTSTGFIDRFLVAAEAYHVPAVLIFNKSDLYGDKEKKKWLEVKGMYEAIGYSIWLISVEKLEGMEAVRNILKDKVTLVSGHSGVGKSTFINYLLPGGAIKTQKVSGWSGKGMHTTTFAEMYDLSFGGAVIDTPGMREFAPADIEPVELSHYFKEMQPLIGNCRFNNCLHVDEPGCFIKEAVAKEEIHVNRYLSYLNILDSIKTKKW